MGPCPVQEHRPCQHGEAPIVLLQGSGDGHYAHFRDGRVPVPGWLHRPLPPRWNGDGRVRSSDCPRARTLPHAGSSLRGLVTARPRSGTRAHPAPRPDPTAARLPAARPPAAVTPIAEQSAESTRCVRLRETPGAPSPTPPVARDCSTSERSEPGAVAAGSSTLPPHQLTARCASCAPRAGSTWPADQWCASHRALTATQAPPKVSL